MKRPKLARIVALSCLAAWAAAAGGCSKIVDIIGDAPCLQKGQGDLSLCATGEAAGRVAGGAEHCCDNKRWENPATCTIVGQQNSAVGAAATARLGGYFLSELKLDANTAVTGALTLDRYYLSRHEFKQNHCPSHAQNCVDELFRRSWAFNGTFTLNGAANASAAADLARGPVPVNVQINAATNKTVLSVGPFSICETGDHENCATMTTATAPPAMVVRVNGQITEIAWVPK